MLMHLSLDVSYLLVLALAVPTAGFLVRVFVMFHDCAHGRRAAAWMTQQGCSPVQAVVSDNRSVRPAATSSATP